MDGNLFLSEGLTYRVLRPEDQEMVVEFIQRYFIPFEPLCVAVGIKPTREKVFPDIIIKNSLWQKASIGVFADATGELCAIRINMLGKNHDALPEKDEDSMHVPEQQTIHRLLAAVKGEGLKKIAGSNNFMEHIFVVVKPTYTKRGIATELYRLSWLLAKKHGCEKMIAISSNAYSRRSVEKAGYVLVKEILFDEYIDKLTGEKSFADITSPHTSISLLVKTLQEN